MVSVKSLSVHGIVMNSVRFFFSQISYGVLPPLVDPHSYIESGFHSSKIRISLLRFTVCVHLNTPIHRNHARSRRWRLRWNELFVSFVAAARGLSEK